MYVLIILVALAVLARLYMRFTGIKRRGQQLKPALPAARAAKTEPPKHKTIFTVWTFAKISLRRYFRDRVALFFTVAFPLIFLLIFGSLSKGSDISFHIGLINDSHTAFSQKFVNQTKTSKSFKVDNTVSTLAQAKAKMSRSEIDATILLPPSFGAVKSGHPTGQAVVYYDQNNAQAAQTLQSVLEGQFQGINSKLVKTPVPFSVAAKSTNTQGLSKLDYTVSGLLGFSILGLGVFGPANYFPQMKKQGVLRRLHITPLRVWEFFISSVLSNALIGLFSIAIMLAVAAGLFGFHMVGNYFELAVFIVLGILTIFGIGLAVGGWAKNENQSAPLTNIISFPMMFLSGTFFPRYAMPQWLQHISAYLPLTPIIDGVRMIATEGEHLTQIGPQIGLTLLWAVVIYAVAFRVFRWE